MTLGYVFLSPHFDDAIGSCGGTIARLVREGTSVTVCTLFGGEGQPPFSVFAQMLHRKWGFEGPPVAGRRREDAEAAAVIGCQAEWLSHPEAIYRKDGNGAPLYARDKDIFGRMRPPDADLPALIAEELERRLDPTAVVCAPASFGRHVDHRIALAVGEALRSAGFRVRFYREFFYGEDPDAAARMANLEQHHAAFGENELTLKCAAFACYRSQVRMLFGDERAMRSHFENAYHRGTGATYAEIFWRDLAEVAEEDSL